MVNRNVFQKASNPIFSSCLGISLIILSCGLSVAIGKSDNLTIGDSKAKIALNRTALELKQNAEKLGEISSEIDSLPQKILVKEKAKKVEQSIQENLEDLQEVLE